MLREGLWFLMRLLKLAAIVVSLVQLLIFLPLSLEHSQETFLTFSALMAMFYFSLTTMRLLTADTRFKYVTRIIMSLQNFVIPAALFLCARLYAPDASHASHTSTPQPFSATSVPWMQSVSKAQMWLASRTPFSWGVKQEEVVPKDQFFSTLLHMAQYSLSRVPGAWYSFLLYMSPVFSLLEGLASLLVVQAVARFSQWLIHDPHGRRTRRISSSVLIRKLLQLGIEASEAWQLVFLLFSSTVYVASSVGLYVSFEGATNGRPLTAAAIGACVASTLWVTGFALAFRKANIVETCLMYAYVVFNVYQLSTSLLLGTDPLHLLHSFRSKNFSAVLLNGPTGAILDRMTNAIEHGLRVFSVAMETLPPTVIVNLVYRVTVMYLATRVLVILEWQSQYRSAPVSTPSDTNWLDTEETAKLSELMMSAKEPSSSDETDTPDYTSAEEPMDMPEYEERPVRSRIMEKDEERKNDTRPSSLGMVFVRYSRFVLITVYSHLLLLDQNHQIYWRMLAVSFTLGLWGIELLLSKEDAVVSYD